MIRLKYYRELRGWTQTELARESGVAQSSISEIEAGENKEPRLPMMLKLARTLGISIEELAGAQKVVNE